MLLLLKKNFRIIIILLLLTTSVVGMIILKQSLENSQLEFGILNNSQYSTYETYFYLFQYLLILTILYIIGSWIFNRYKEFRQLKNEKSKAELQLLKSQINPHFFFNTLNNLYGLTVEKSDKAPEMILKLSEMMRYTIYEGKEDFVPLKDEITYLKNYIELHKIRYKKKVNISFNLDVKHNYNIASLLFIILLENAFKHGVEGLTEDAYITIKLKTTDNTMLFSVENNFDTTKKNEKAGIGISNLRQRLKLIYPNKHNLSIEKQKVVYNAKLEIQTK
ncbi:sensor histidine kinase [Winogradskyella sp. R77965]|uniref:sensor histidine kinase n=1 Tax=Winogradskyella sp. R77965 TaxID=3093872 RepID=UPI0037DD95A7